MLCNVFASVHTWIQSSACRGRYFGVGIYDRLRSAGDWREDFWQGVVILAANNLY